nr:CGNR zinc finger domain-containing protein [uncultured Gellertiella sp.]
MTFTWTPHRFSGGALALDVANSVILRADPARRTDRLAEPAALHAFAGAATAHSAERELFGALSPLEADERAALVALREAIDSYFRGIVCGKDDPLLLAALLDEIAASLRRPARPGDLMAATARSALGLISAEQRARMKICGNCGWLFLDRSKNRSRMWCDMAVCGNRIKARKHYRATKRQQEDCG